MGLTAKWLLNARRHAYLERLAEAVRTIVHDHGHLPLREVDADLLETRRQARDVAEQGLQARTAEVQPPQSVYVTEPHALHSSNWSCRYCTLTVSEERTPAVSDPFGSPAAG